MDNGGPVSTDGACAPVARSYCFGPFVLVPGQQLLLQGGSPLRIGSRSFEILTALVERPGELVSKADLLARAWPSTFVEEGNLKVNVAALRRTLGEATGGARYIAAVRGRGYRFVAPVRIVEPPVVASPAGGLSARNHNLPASMTRLVGRADAVEAIGRQLGLSRLVTIVGPGGIGKTRVALAAAGRALPHFAQGAWLVDLSSVADPALVPAAIAAAIGLRVHSASILAALAAHLRDRELLLALDNCEHLVDAVATCAESLLPASAGLRLLATSREPLRVGGEFLYRLPPLSMPAGSAGLTASAALEFPAIELFAERAAGGPGAFVLGDADAPVVAEICRRLDGMALAIELAATRVDAFGARDLLELLDDRFQLLEGRRAGQERHRTLAAALDWSYDLLPEGERRLLAHLSVFAGAFGLEAACAVAGEDSADRAACAAGIANLVAKSLLSLERTGEETLYRLLDTTRRYALRKLAECGEADRLRLRHAGHLRDVAERAEMEWAVLPTGTWLGRYGRMVDDIRSALGWAFGAGAGAGRIDGRAVGVALTVAAIPFWEHLSLVEECRASVERALDPDLDVLRSERDDMKLCMALGTNLLHTRGPLTGVKSAWTRALALAVKLGDSEYELRCLWGLCDYHTWSGDHRAALEIARRIRRTAIEAEDRAARTNVDRQAGTALRYLGRLGDSRRHLERMIGRYVPPVVRADIARFQLDPRSAARGTLANVLWLQGHPERAVQMARRQLGEAEAAEHALALCNALVHAACPIALLVGDIAAAGRLVDRIETHVAEHAMTVWSAMGQCLRGEWLLARGDAAGLPVLHEALERLLGVGFRMRCASYLGTYAAGLGAHGDVDAGRATIDEAVAMATSCGEAWCLPELRRIRADLMSLDGPAAAQTAEDEYARALDEARRQGALSWELRVATSLVGLRRRTGDFAEAAPLLSSICNRFDEGAETADLQRARTLLAEISSTS